MSGSLAALALAPMLQAAGSASPPLFYLSADPRYTPFESALDSVRFTLTKTLQRDERGHLVSISSFVDPDGQVMGWHDFGNLEGPGWAANAVGGAWEIYTLGEFLQRPEWKSNALAILDHVLDCGFVDERTGFIRGYRETTTGKFCLNYKHNSDWFCPGSMAKVAFQMLVFADDLPKQDPRRERLRRIAVQCAGWIQKNVEPVPNGWFPRRVTPEGKVYRKSPDGGDDRFWQGSADGLFILQLQAALTERKLADWKTSLKEKTVVFIRAGGIFGSINHDTYDPQENVAYSVAFRTLLLASRVLKDNSIRAFAYEQCLAGLDSFKMTDDRNGVATKGLLFMEKSWDTAYLWENAEAALAYFEAAADMRARPLTPAFSPDEGEGARRAGAKVRPTGMARDYELDGLTILRAIAKHHHGPHGFLTEGVDWNDHVSQKHHIGQAKYGDIQYTEPFLNNQHIAEPTLFYLQHLARKSSKAGQPEWRDAEGNLLIKLPRGRQPEGRAAPSSQQAGGLFSRTNLVAWCIVPFDAKKRAPEERAAMLERLGFKLFAYDYRAEHIPTFDAEMEALSRHHVRLLAWWFPGALNDEARLILDVLKRHGLRRVQLWVTGAGEPTKTPEEQKARVEAEAARLRPIAEAAAKIGCTGALYNHGAWFGEPENQLAIIERLREAGVTNVGIVYNLHHGHDHLDRFAELLAKLKPHLVALNLNGMTRDGDKAGKMILPLAQGDLDLKLLKVIRDSGWRGPVGILNHTDEDAETRLKQNLVGLDRLVGAMGQQSAEVKTYPDPPARK